MEVIDNQTEVKVDAYTTLRTKTLSHLVQALLTEGALDRTLRNAIDLGCFQGSSSQALRNNGISQVISVDSNDNALVAGVRAGIITNAVNSDMVDYVQNQMPQGYKGLITAFNCILYLPEDRIRLLFDGLSKKLSQGSEIVFTFSKSQDKWVERFNNLFGDSGAWKINLLKGKVRGGLDYNTFILTKK